MASEALALPVTRFPEFGVVREGAHYMSAQEFAELPADALRLLASRDFALPEHIREQQFQSDPELRDRLMSKWFSPEPLACRLATVTAILARSGARRILDLGCGVGHLLSVLEQELDCELLVGVDPRTESIAVARALLSESKSTDIRLINAHFDASRSVLKDVGIDAVVLMEVVEHMRDGEATALVERVCETTNPALLVLTTPNRDFNLRMKSLAANGLRRTDHVREFDREEFADWTRGLSSNLRLDVALVAPVGLNDLFAGPPTQVAVLQRRPARFSLFA